MKKKIKIAIIAGQLVVGGAEKQLYLWLANLNREQFTPIVLTLHPGHGDFWEKPIENLGIPIFSFPQRENPIRRLINIIRVLRPYQPDLVHGWHLFASPYAALAAKYLGAKSLGGLRDTYQTFRDHAQEAKLTLCFTDSILANSNFAASQLKVAKYRKNQKIFTVQNAVNDQFTSREESRKILSQKYGLNINTIWIGSISRLASKKQYELLIQVTALLKETINDFHILIIGDGPERDNLQNLAKKIQVSDKILFTGEIPQASNWTKALDIFTFTSMDEGMPNVIMEAAAAGLPIVTWRYPFIEELLKDGESALLIEPGDLDSMKTAIHNLIKSPELREELGTAARNHILKNFSIERYVQAMSAVYDSVING